MTRWAVVLGCLWMAATGLGQTAESVVEVELTDAEKFYLQELGPVRMCVDPDGYPYELVTAEGEFVGIAADLIRLVADRVGIELELVRTGAWSESLQYSRQGRAHILAFLDRTPQRDEWLLFTEPYFVDANVFITRNEHAYIFDPAVLVGASIAIPEGSSIEDRIRRDFPNLRIVPVATEQDAFDLVEQRRVDMTLRSLTLAAYMIRSQGLFNLKNAGEFPEYVNELRIGVVQHQPMLRDILDKGIATLKPQEVREVVNRHVAITMVRPVDYAWVAKVGAALLAALLLAALWAMQLRDLNRRLVQKQLELQESERSKSSLLANLPGIAYRCRYDEEWTLEYISEGCFALTGFHSDELLGNRLISYREVIAPEDRTRVREAWASAVETHVPAEIEYRIVRADSLVRWVWERGVAVYDASGAVAMLEGIIIDITSHKQSEERLDQLEKAESLQRMAGAIAHHYNNLLGGVLGNLELALEDAPRADTDLRSSLEMAMGSARRAADMGSIMLEYIGQDVDRREMLDLAAACRGFLPEMVARAGTETSLIAEIPDVSLWVEGAVRQIRSTVFSVAVNAFEAVEAAHGEGRGVGHGGEVRVTLCRVSSGAIEAEHCFPAGFWPQAREYACLSVQDNGSGIAEETIRKIFDPFFSTKFTGRGLGLAVVLGTVKAYSGCVTVASVPGRGCTFRIYLPLAGKIEGKTQEFS